MSTLVSSPSVPVSPLAAPAAVKATKTWLIGPWFDLLFLANLAWPAVVLAALAGSTTFHDRLSFLQIYFLSSPHRWITLVLVFCDRERFWKEPAKFGGIGLGLVALGLLLVAASSYVPYATDSLTLLMMLDYVWNAWHFAAQHAGIARIYGRFARPTQSPRGTEFEKIAIRIAVLWIFFRLAVYLSLHGPNPGFGEFLTTVLPWLDPIALLPALVLLVNEWRDFTPAACGRVLYITSVLTLYTGQLAALRLGAEAWMQALFLAGAVFHAVEYLAVCRWAMQKKTTGIWHYQLARTGLAVVAFMVVLGCANALVYYGWSVYYWALITLLVSLLHYCYDGIIWKARPQPRPAAV
jgi:hypothetical protein